ncbi:TPA: hypothetical protein KQG29_001563 [Clostridioides difficile]|nr:hypothetical protein [Clostridioides difficile]
MNIPLNSITIPPLPNLIEGIPPSPLIFVMGIERKYFSLLNNSKAELLDLSSQKKLTMNKNISKHCVFIVSKIFIGITNGRKLKNFKNDKFNYIGYIEKEDEEKSYIYIIPKKYVYKINICALILTSKKIDKFYNGFKLIKQDGEPVYLYVIPYQYKKYSYSILALKYSSNFNKEIKLILNHWINKNYIFDFNLTYLETYIDKTYNLAIQHYSSTINENYTYLSKSLENKISNEELIKYSMK